VRSNAFQAQRARVVLDARNVVAQTLTRSW
jgi:hypothetical protein